MDPIFSRPSCVASHVSWCFTSDDVHTMDVDRVSLAMSRPRSSSSCIHTWYSSKLVHACVSHKSGCCFCWWNNCFVSDEAFVFPLLNLQRLSVSLWTSWWFTPWHTGSKLHHRWVSGKKSPEPEPTAQCISSCPWEGIRCIELLENRQASCSSTLFYLSAQLACTVQMLCTFVQQVTR